jgi:hypothetical protein
MVMMIKRWSALFFACLLPLTAGAQSDDFGIWYSATARLGITARLDADISAELRTYNNAGKVEQGFLEAGFNYKLTDFLSAGASYRLTEAIEDDSRYHPQHKLFLEVKGNLKPGNFTVQGRVRYQIRFKTYIEDAEDKIPDHTVRLKLKAVYRTTAFPLNPYLYSETFIPVFRNSEKLIGKNRFGAGVEYSISKKHSIEAGYIFQRDYLPHLIDEHIIQAGYTFSF